MVDPVEYPIQTCAQCGKKNRVAPHSLLRMKPVCAECGSRLDDPYWIVPDVESNTEKALSASSYPIESCPACGQQNRIRPHSISYKPVCAKCGTAIYDPFRSGEEQWTADSGGMVIAKLPFKLLPPGSWTIDDVIAHYRQQAENLPGCFSGKELHWRRLQMIKTLGPNRCWVGEDSWKGYSVFMFSFSSKAVFECPFKGNATYVISGNWQSVGRHTKHDLRKLFPDQYAKVVHKGDWLTRISQHL